MNGFWNGGLSRLSKAKGLVTALLVLAKRSLSAGDSRRQLGLENE